MINVYMGKPFFRVHDYLYTMTTIAIQELNPELHVWYQNGLSTLNKLAICESSDKRSQRK